MRAAALRRRLTPDAAKHRAYLREVRAYIAESRVAPPRLVHDGRVGDITALELWPSVLFGRRYLVAYADARWYHAVAPGSDAITSTLSDTHALPPLVIVPYEPRYARRGRILRAIVEHEFVHINQAILGTLAPSPRGSASSRLASVFFTRLRNEYEAHLVQAIRWPQFFPREFGLSLPHWCVLRGYTDALEAIFVAAWRGEFRRLDLVTFLDRLPRRLGTWLRALGVDAPTLAPWFRRHVLLHVTAALLNLATTRPGFGTSTVFRTGHGWVASAAAWRSARRAPTGGAPVEAVALVPRPAAHVPAVSTFAQPR